MTLVEVVAGLGLLGALLTGLLLAKAGLSRQRAQADQRLAAVAACDRLLSQWRAGGGQVPTDTTGQAAPGLVWTTRALAPQRVEQATVEVIRLEVRNEHRGDKPLATVEVLQSPYAGANR